MPCERVKCAQCLTVMALRNQTRRVKQFVPSLDKTKPFDPSVVAFSSLPRLIRFSHNEGDDITQLQDYLLLHPNEPHLSFTELSPSLMQPNQPWNYQVRPFHCIIFHCKSVDPTSLRWSLRLTVSIHCIYTMRSGVCMSLLGWIGTRTPTSTRSWSRSPSYQLLQRPTIAITWVKSSPNRTSIAHSQQKDRKSVV